MGVEEQKEEREVLESIFPDEITDISDTAYRISITLDDAGSSHADPSSSSEGDGPPVLLLTVTYPDTYPDTAPHLEIGGAPNAAPNKFPFLDVQTDRAELLEALQPTVEDNLGMAMVFTLVTTLKEVAEGLVAERRQQQEKVRAVEAAKKEEEENRKFHGEAVTRERFIEWRERFRAEITERERVEREETEADERKKRGGRIAVEEKGKLTGRQLWEKGLVGKGDEADDSDVTLIDGVEKLKVDA